MLPEAEVFASAADAFDTVVSRLPDDGWDRPGLGAWDMRALVGHASRALITVSTYLDRPATEVVADSAAAYYALATGSGADEAAVAERGRQAGEALGPDPRARIHSLVHDVVAQVSGSDDALIETIAGGMWLHDYLPTRTFELAVHSLDIAKAAELPFTLPPDVLGPAVALAAEIGVAIGTGEAILIALTGRAALSEGFSVV